MNTFLCHCFWFVKCIYKCTTNNTCEHFCFGAYSTNIVRESSRVRAGACRGPGGSWEVRAVTCELFVQPTKVHALSDRKWVEYTSRPAPQTHTQTLKVRAWNRETISLSATITEHCINLCSYQIPWRLQIYSVHPALSFTAFALLLLLFLCISCFKAIRHLPHCYSLTLLHNLFLHIPYNYYDHNPYNHCKHQTLCFNNPAWMMCVLIPSLTYNDTYTHACTHLNSVHLKSKTVLIYSTHINGVLDNSPANVLANEFVYIAANCLCILLRTILLLLLGFVHKCVCVHFAAL